ncbi:hypothetical protein BH23ACI1_BH23ACI1_03860 [soil metagenome]
MKVEEAAPQGTVNENRGIEGAHPGSKNPGQVVPGAEIP